MAHDALRMMVRATEKVTGRRRLAQFARLMTDEVRLDTANDISLNGERDVQRVAVSFPTPVVFDVGAHFGEWTMSLLSLSSVTADVHCFEPATSSHRLAAANLVGRASVHKLALSDTMGSAPLNITHEGAGSNSLSSFDDYAGFTDLPTEEVDVDTFDHFRGKHDLDRVTLLKVDAEGHDMAVIRGARQSLEARAIDLVQFEYNWRWIAARHYLLDAFDLFLSCGYRLGKITPRGIEDYPAWHPELEKFTEANFLAYLPEHHDRFSHIEWWESQRHALS
jgi:FkbM family methyltransferase